MVQKVKAYVEKYHMIAPGDTVIAGVSGGADSVCLLLMLLCLKETIPFDIAIVHVNHGIRKEAGEDAAYVQALAKRFRLPFYLVEENVKEYAKKKRLSLEEAGRIVRYRAFFRILEKISGGGSGKIAVAHSQNDRAETLLFHLFRGSGLNGLGSIRPVRGNVIRPLLCLRRDEIEAYLAKEGAAYCTDATNAEEIYTRNKIRHSILPAAESICTGSIAHMADAAEIAGEAYDYIRQSAEQFCDTNVIKKDNGLVLAAAPFLSVHPIVQKEVIRQCVGRMMPEGGRGRLCDISRTHLRDVASLFLLEGNRQIVLPGGLYARREYGEVVFGSRDTHPPAQGKETAQPFCAEVFGECDKDVPGLGTVRFRIFPYEKNKNIPEKTYTKWFDYDKIIKSLVIRTRQAGDYLTVNEELGRKTLKAYMIQEKIPKGVRDQVYVLADGSHILWVIGRRISWQYKVGKQTKKILQVQVERKESVTWLKE